MKWWEWRLVAAQLLWGVAGGLFVSEHASQAVPAQATAPFLGLKLNKAGVAKRSSRRTESTVELPQCNWTRDLDGVVRPAVCVGKGEEVQCTPAAQPAFTTDGTCKPPPLKPCTTPDFGELTSTYMLNFTGSTSAFPVHGNTLGVSCAEGMAAIDGRYSNDTWGQKSYIGRQSWVSVCNNGTWTHMTRFKQKFLRPDELICVTLKQIELLRVVEHYVRWTQASLLRADAALFKWIDATALGRRAALTSAQSSSWQILGEAKNGTVPAAAELERVIEAMKSNSIIHRGEPQGPATCSDLQSRFTSVGFKCSYTAEKTPIRRDPVTQEAEYFYRDGCYCESAWIDMCPFRLDLVPTFTRLGFQAIEQKELSREPGPGAKALCWYWSDASHPEWGYLRIAT